MSRSDGSQSAGGAMLDPRVLDDVVRRIVAVAQPERIVLYRRDLAGRIYENLYGVGAAVDVVVVTPEDVDRYRNSHALVIKPALDEGRVVYESS